MADNVFILGAGASCESGAPLMATFLDVAEDLWRANAFKEVEKGRVGKIFELLSELQRVYAKSYLDLNNIEHLFGALELARITGRLGNYSPEEISEFRDALVTLIVRTLEKCVHFPVVDKKHVRPTPSYNALVKLIQTKDTGKVIGTSSIITLNYDIALDFAFYANDVKIDYGLISAPAESVKVLKLHGSINWGRCLQCGEIYPYLLPAYRTKYGWMDLELFPSVSFAISHKLQDLKENHKHEGENKGFAATPVIVPPTWNKTEYHGALSRVWNIAAKELSEARNIYVMGYSLPESDSFFRYLFALGTIGQTRIRRFWVFDIDDSEAFKTRFKRLVGQGIADRVDFIKTDFSHASIELAERIRG